MEPAIQRQVGWFTRLLDILVSQFIQLTVELTLPCSELTGLGCVFNRSTLFPQSSIPGGFIACYYCIRQWHLMRLQTSGNHQPTHRPIFFSPSRCQFALTFPPSPDPPSKTSYRFDRSYHFLQAQYQSSLGLAPPIF